MRTHGFQPDEPILVNKTTERIISGHHRFQAALEAKLEYLYFQYTDMDRPIDNRTPATPWMSPQFVEMYCKTGHPIYLKVAEWSKRAKISIGTFSSIFCSADARTRISDGSFTISEYVEKLMDEFAEVADCVDDGLSGLYGEIRPYTLTLAIISLSRWSLKNRLSYCRLRKKMQYKIVRDRFKKTDTKAIQLQKIEDAYNLRETQEDSLYFVSAIMKEAK
jgi:hypothetical protein